MMNKTFHIGSHQVGCGQPALVIAESGVNHNGDVDRAAELIRAARRAGADCVKFQTFKAERVVTADAPKANYQTHVTDLRHCNGL
jgi:N,N'-diacetyllegionaminate synthase